MDYNRQVDVTVVIPTLGSDKLNRTIECVRQSSVVVSKVLVCIPDEYAGNALLVEDELVDVHITETKGQVAQRISGFKEVKTSITLQMDDDVMFEKEAIEILTNKLMSYGRGTAVSGVVDRGNSKVNSSKRKRILPAILKELFVRCIAGAPERREERIGKYSKYSWCQLVPAGTGDKEDRLVDFLPGGCCMSWTDELVMYNYYPLGGKAYKEDLLNSIERAKKEIRHIVIPEVVFKTEEHVTSVLSLSALYGEFKASRRVGRILGCHPLSIRLHIYIIAEVFYGVWRKIRSRNQQ